VQLRALAKVLRITKGFAFDVDPERASHFAAEMSESLDIEIAVASQLGAALRHSDVCITCTPSQHWIVDYRDVRPGTFIAGVGADNEHKQELHPQLLAENKVVVDLLEQCAAIGDLHHAIATGVATRNAIYAELGEVVAGHKAGRTCDEEITIFDSTGTALQDVAAAAIVYEKAVAGGNTPVIDFFA
jgi:ornithine cyclodeaminase/alanine dehydrogenase-like protein (mu-crystallin family)